MGEVEKNKKRRRDLVGAESGNDASGEKPDADSRPLIRDLVLSAGAAFDDLVSDTPAVAAPEKHAPSEEAPAADPAPAGKGKKRKKKDAPQVAWNESTAGLDFVENEPPAPQATDDAASNEEEGDAMARFEALARRLAETVSRKAEGESESAIEAAGEAPVMESQEAAPEMSAEMSPETSAETPAEATLEAAPATELEAASETELEATEPTLEMAPEAELEASAEETPEAALEAQAEEAPEAALEAATDAPELEASAETTEEEAPPEMALADFQEGLDAAENDADPEPQEFVEQDQLISVIESLLFSTDKPVSVATIKQIFKGSNIRTKDIQRSLEILASEYAAPMRGVTLEEVNGGYQLRTKSDNAEFMRRLAKVRPFRLSGPALEVMAIIAYKQPVTKHEIDEIRGVESGHLLRALMERGLVSFNGKSDLPGKPMTYGSTRKFLETFGLRNLRELPTLSEIDELIPEGIGEVEEKETLSDITEQMSTELTHSYSEGEEELAKINEQLQAVDTTSEFFEQEKQRERDRKERERAQDIRERLVLGEAVEEKDRRWLDRYDAKLLAPQTAETPVEAETAGHEPTPITGQLEALTEEAEADQLIKAHAQDENAEEAELAAELESEEIDELAVNADWDEDSEPEA